MNILIVLDQYYPLGGGIQQYIRGLAQQLTRTGHKITILTRAIENLPDREQWPEADIIRTPLLDGALPNPALMLERWPQLVPIMESVKPDVVYANNHTSIGSIKAAQAAGIPVAYGCHGWGLFCTLKIRLLKPDGSLCYNERSVENCLHCHDLITPPPPPPRIKGMGRTLVASSWQRLTWQRRRRAEFAPQVDVYDGFQAILESADARMANSKLTASLFRSEKTYAVYLGMDFEQFKPVDDRPLRDTLGLGDAPYLTLAGRLVRTKGHEWAIRALTHLPSEMKLLIIGANGSVVKENEKQYEETPYVQSLRAIAAECGVADRLIFTGLLFPDDLSRAYSGAVANLMPSVWLEAFGYVTAEAMACACPAIATDNSGAAELIVNGVNGYRVPRMDAEAIAQAVLKIQHNRQAMGQAALQTAREQLDWPVIADQVLHILQSIQQ